MAESGEYQTFLLQLPSGGWVEVRPATTATLMGAGHTFSPLLSLACRAVRRDDEDDEDERPVEDVGPFAIMQRYCETVLVNPRMPQDIQFDDVCFADLHTIYQWAVTGQGQAKPHRQRHFQADDFHGLVTSDAALHMDMLCNRYHVRPSTALGLEGATFALDLDLAVAFRAAKRESDAMSKDVEVRDIMGDTHRVPRDWLPETPSASQASVTKGKTLAKLWLRGGRKEMALSVGGLGGDAALGPLPRPGSLDRSGY